MNKLPPELLANIIDTWPRGIPLAQYSTISRAWQASIERLTFQRLTITTDELDQFAAVFSGDKISRWAHLVDLRVNFILPVPPNADGCCAVVQPPSREADSIEFSASVGRLFTILAEVAAQAPEERSFSLCFYTGYRRTKSQELRASSIAPCRKSSEIQGHKHSRRQIREAQAVSGQFELLPGAIVPIVRGATTFEHVGLHYLDDLESTWIPKIVSRLPDLVKLRLRLLDQYQDGRRKRAERKACFVASLRNFASNHLREIRISSDGLVMRNEHSPVHKFVDDGFYSQEPWFCILSHFASLPNLTILQLYGGLVVSPKLFRAIFDHPGTPFPSLVEFELQFEPETADGRWFFAGDESTIEKSRREPKWNQFWKQMAEQEADRNSITRRTPRSEDSDHYERVYEDEPFRTAVVDFDQFRSLPAKDTLLPFVVDASKAVSRIPNLKKFILKLGNVWAEPNVLTLWPIVSRVFELWYLKAGMHRSPPRDLLDLNLNDPYIPGDAAYLNRNRLYWRVGDAEVCDEVQAPWNAIAGPDAKIVFMDENHWMKNEWDNQIPIGHAYGYQAKF